MPTLSKPLKCLTAAAFAASAVTAAAAQDILTLADPEVVLNIAKGFGSADLDVDNGGDPVVKGRMQGLKYDIFFYSCKDGKNCRSIQFSSYSPDPWTIEKANKWNNEFRWVKAYENEGAYFRMDVDFKGGVTKQFLEEQFVTWESFVPDIKEALK